MISGKNSVHKSKSEKHNIFDALPGALIEVNFASRSVVYMNIIAQSVFEYSEADVSVGLLAEDIFLNKGEFEKALKTVESFGLADYQAKTTYTRYARQDLYDFMLRKKGGTGFYGECQGSFILSEDGVPLGIHLYIRDLTEQRLMEMSLHESEEKYRTLVEYSSDLIFLISGQGIVLSLNRAALDSMHKQVEEVQGKHLYELFPEDIAEGYKLNVDIAFTTGESALYETTMPSNTQKIWLSTSVNPVKDRNGKVTAVLAVSRDITERKIAEEQVEMALVRARQANRVKDQFIANISHEIRTPLTSIIGYTGRLKESLGKALKSEEEGFFHSINRSSNRLLRTVDAILNVSQVEAGTLQLSPKKLHLEQLCEMICDELQPLAVKTGIELEFTSDVEDDQISIDESSIYQALVNLIQNAIKYTSEGGVYIRLRKTEKRMVLTIMDTGIGISEEYHMRMFQPFSQESEGLSKSYQGLGLGLALTKRYLDRIQIKIRVDSKKNRGSTFTLTFPEC